MHDISGHITIRPPLNEAERAFLDELRTSNRTLRGTPTGRGDATVPFSRSAWRSCERGCCLTWTASEWSRNLAPTLDFLIRHLFGPGAKAKHHPRFEEFSFDHVLEGVVVAKGYDDRHAHVVQVVGNVVHGATAERACEETVCVPRPRLSENVIDFTSRVRRR